MHEDAVLVEYDLATLLVRQLDHALGAVVEQQIMLLPGSQDAFVVLAIASGIVFLVS